MSADTTTGPRAAAARGATRDRVPTVMPPVRGRRRPWLIVLGVLLASVGALAVVWLVGAAGQRIEVLVVRQDVPYGQELTASDVGLARVSVDPGVAVLAATERDGLVGRFATTHLRPGMLLSADMVGADRGPARGQAQVPVAIAAERMPAGGLRAGDRISAVDAGDSGAPPAAARTFPATVVRVGTADVNGVTVVDVVTSPADAPGLAVASANGRVAVVLQASVG